MAISVKKVICEGKEEKGKKPTPAARGSRCGVRRGVPDKCREMAILKVQGRMEEAKVVIHRKGKEKRWQYVT